MWVRSGRGAEFEEVRDRAGRLAVVVRGASPGVGGSGGLDEDWPHADAPRATEAAREQSRGRRRELLSNHCFTCRFSKAAHIQTELTTWTVCETFSHYKRFK